MNRRLATLLLPLLLVTAGCTAEPGGPPTSRQASRPSPFADCATLTVPPTPAARPAQAAGTGTGTALPDLTLPCFTGGDQVSLRDVRGPAVINVWASWCAPCREELPAFQRLSERTAGRLQVLGVNSRDTRAGAQSIGEDFGVRFPTLVDQGESLQRALTRNAIPLTLFVDADGRVRHVDATGALDDARLAGLVREHLGLDVPA